MRISEFMAPVAPTTATGSAMTGSAMSANPQQQRADPKMQAAMAAQQQQDKIQSRKQIQDRIAMLNKEMADLRKQLASIR